MKLSLSHAALSVCMCATAAACASGSRHVDPANTVTAEDIARNEGVPIEKVLQAKVPGVNILRTADGGIAIQIRGESSMYGGTAPLYVVDDVPFEPGPGGALLGINPYDIESIKVLKNPEDVARWGMRGANGVIVITMKKPGK
jgi:TonB-dependent SusC/RagA subfamily outer membrane receptor